MNNVARRRLIRSLSIPIGMIVGGAVQNLARVTMPAGAVKEFFTTGFAWSVAATHTVPLFIGTISFGPLAIDVSLIAVLGIVLTERLATNSFP